MVGGDSKYMSKVSLYPLKFQEVYKEKPWGGRRLETVVNKSLPSGKAIGESWEVSDHPNGPGKVRTGALEGKTIRELIDEYGADFIGSELMASSGTTRFPLLIKFLDISDEVSLQVHPDRQSAEEFNEESAKHEAWYVIAAEKGAFLVCGLEPDVDAEELKPMLEPDMPIAQRREHLQRVLNYISVHKGDIINLPAGTVHYAGGGIVLAEIQQNSDVTYRMFDWGRVNADGTKRPLYLQQAFASIRRDPKAGLVQMHKLSSYPYDRYNVIDNDQFCVELIETSDFASEIQEQVSKKRFHILMVISGNGELEYLSSQGRRFYTPFSSGETIFLPAALGDYSIHGFSLRLLKITPVSSAL